MTDAMNNRCHRCGLRLNGRRITTLRIATIDADAIERRICDTCNASLRHWFVIGGPRSERAQSDFSDITPQIEYFRKRAERGE